MTQRAPKSATNLFIVDNSDADWKVADYLRQWTEIARAFDIATGYFEIGALLALDGAWQQLEQIRILMGDEVSKRTRHAFEAAVTELLGRLDASLEAAKDADDFLSGVPGIVEALQSGQILARVYRKKKFHAKAYITHGKLDIIGSTALVGSSNFTYPGLSANIELNVQLQREVERLQEWYETHWQAAEDVTPDILRTIARHTREYTPFEVYLRALVAYFQRHEVQASEWERTQSRVYPLLDQYQRDAYQQLLEIAARHRGAFLCDGVGLGKTFVGLMLIERLLFERKRIALFVPKATRADVWEVKLKRYLPKAGGKYSNLALFNHTDLLRGGKFPEWMREVQEEADVIIIDEAHHFRNTSSQRYREFFDIVAGKQMFFLTATPINNSFYDLMHMIELFTQREPGYFSAAPLGIHTLRGHFRQMERALDALTGAAQSAVELDTRAAEAVLAQDNLFRALVVQRSRAYVKQSLRQHAGAQQVAFPQRGDPRVAGYSLARTYGDLLDKLEAAFQKDTPLVTLPIYFPLNYLLTEDDAVDPMAQGRQRQVVGLIRTLLLKRFESSVKSFEASCEDLLLKLLYFVRLHNPRTAQRWEAQHAALLERVQAHQRQRGWRVAAEEEADEDLIPEEFKQKIEVLDDQVYNVAAMVMDTLLDMDELARFLAQLRDFDPARDDKLQRLIHLLQTDPVLRDHKVLLFTEYRDTARYLHAQLAAAGIGPLAEVDSTVKNRSAVIRAFSPYYNESSSAELAAEGRAEIRVLIATDVLAEGLNLQDAACIINYDLHWNPVRLMQRIGRVDRRLDPAIEAQMLAAHPDRAAVRGKVYLWNFLPPAELNRILSLYERVTRKTLRISKTFGIEGQKLLTPEDDYEALREFNEAYEGQTSSIEEMRLEYDRLVQAHPELVARAPTLPLRLFSGKVAPETRAVFCCYRLPAQEPETDDWTADAGFTRWYLYDVTTGAIEDDAPRIFDVIRCPPETPRETALPQAELSAIRKTLDKHILNTYLKKIQAPQGVKATLLAWMELV